MADEQFRLLESQAADVDAAEAAAEALRAIKRLARELAEAVEDFSRVTEHDTWSLVIHRDLGASPKCRATVHTEGVKRKGCNSNMDLEIF